MMLKNEVAEVVLVLQLLPSYIVIPESGQSDILQILGLEVV